MRSLHHVRIQMFAPFVTSLLAAACATQSARDQPPQQAQLARALSPPERAGPPLFLSETARTILKSRMASHSRDMGELVSAIMILDYPRIESDAGRIAADVSLARPLTNDATELNASFPEKFFVHQDDLRVEARALAVASHALDAYGVAASYGRMSAACVRCHADFRPST
jgi:cytochrome c556